MTNPNQPRSPHRTGDQELFQLLIRSIDKLRTLPSEVGDGNTNVVAELQNIVTAIDANTAAITQCLNEIQAEFAQVVYEGGAAIGLSTPTASVFTLSTDWVEVQAYDTRDLPETGATADETTGRITFQQPGFWLLSFSIEADVASSSANNTRTLDAGLFDTVGLTGRLFASASVPRYAANVSLSATLRVPVTQALVGVPFSIGVRAPDGDLDFTQFNLVEYSVSRVSNVDTVPT